MAVGPIRETQPTHPSPSAATIGEVRPNFSSEEIKEGIDTARGLIRQSKSGPMGRVERRPLTQSAEMSRVPAYKIPQRVKIGHELHPEVEDKPRLQVAPGVSPAMLLAELLRPNKSLGTLAKQAYAEQRALGQRS